MFVLFRFCDVSPSIIVLSSVRRCLHIETRERQPFAMSTEKKKPIEKKDFFFFAVFVCLASTQRGLAATSIHSRGSIKIIV